MRDPLQTRLARSDSEPRGNNVTGFKDVHAEIGASQGQNLALTGGCFPSSLDTGYTSRPAQGQILALACATFRPAPVKILAETHCKLAWPGFETHYNGSKLRVRSLSSNVNRLQMEFGADPLQILLAKL